jgi:ATP-dependent Clp protease ATP-binding subunit ClpA
MFTNLTAQYANNNDPQIKGREIEINNLFLTLLRHEKPNALLVGEPGVGKTSIINQLAYLIANGQCPNELKGFQVIEVNTNALISGDGYRGVIEKKFQDMIDNAIRKGKIILFMDEFHTVENLGKMANNSTPGLGNTLKPYLTRGDFRLIGATTYKEAAEITDKALLRRFSKITVGEPDDFVTKEIIKICYNKYIGSNKIKVDPSVIDLTYDLSITLEGLNPDKAKDIVDIIVANAKLTNTSTIDYDFTSKSFDAFFLKLKEQEKSEDCFSLQQ